MPLAARQAAAQAHVRIKNYFLAEKKKGKNEEKKKRKNEEKKKKNEEQEEEEEKKEKKLKVKDLVDLEVKKPITFTIVSTNISETDCKGKRVLIQYRDCQLN